MAVGVHLCIHTLGVFMAMYFKPETNVSFMRMVDILCLNKWLYSLSITITILHIAYKVNLFRLDLLSTKLSSLCFLCLPRSKKKAVGIDCSLYGFVLRNFFSA